MGTTEMDNNVQSFRGGETDDGANTALVRKIDWRIIPTLLLAYFLQFLDKVAVNVRCDLLVVAHVRANQLSM